MINDHQYNTNAAWVFGVEPLMGGALSSAYQNLLSGSNLTQEEKFAREIIQNSNDAIVGDQVQVDIYRRLLEGEEFKQFVDNMALKDTGSPLERIDFFTGLPKDNFFQRILDGFDSLEVTMAEDFGTCGLGYTGGKNRFDSLCIEIGRRDQDLQNHADGGTYGFGGSVLSSCSDVKTIIVYSAFKPCSDGNHDCVGEGVVGTKCNYETAKLMACSFFNNHSVGVHQYEGRAWFGIPGGDANYPTCSPLVDASAHQFAKALGFTLRGPDKLGTSIMILGTSINMNQMRSAIENWWWPSLTDGSLQISLIDEIDDVEDPDPLNRPDLRPFIDCYGQIDQNMSSTDDITTHTFPRSGGLKLGKLALTTLEADSKYDDPESEKETDLRDSVALIRNGPKMVVAYLQMSVGNSAIHFAGTFISDHDAERVLQLAEPQLHNRWDPNNGRLMESLEIYRPGGISEDEHRLVRNLQTRIKTQVRNFRNRLGSNLPNTSGRNIRDLERILGRVLAGLGTGRPPPPPPVRDDFHILVEEERNPLDRESGLRHVELTVKISLKEEAEADKMEVIFEPQFTTTLDDLLGISSTERLALKEVVLDGNKQELVEDGKFRFSVNKKSQRVIKVKTAKYNGELMVVRSARVSEVKIAANNTEDE